VRQKIRAAQQALTLPRGRTEEMAEAAREACLNAIEVDVFTPEEYTAPQPHGVTATGNGGQ
jgi:hypothetical protein